ncbi:MAG: 3D domain-containing protein [Coprococcus sp.]|nr:3D domain-containing protein [Coprococcus sp.]
MKKFSDSSKMKSQKLMKTTLRDNIKKISIGTVLLAVGVASYAVVSNDGSMVSAKGKTISVAEAGNTLYAENVADYEDATAMVLADGELSDVNRTGSAALSSKKATRKEVVISAGASQVTESTEAVYEPLASTTETIRQEDVQGDKSVAGLPEDEISVDPSTEKSTEGLPDDKVMYVDGAASGTYLGKFWITAYCPCSICCGIWSNPTNPSTASGAPAVEGVTCAAPSNFEFGTELIVDGHTYVVQDRGGAVQGQHLDIYFSTHEAALNFATGYYDVYIK